MPPHHEPFKRGTTHLVMLVLLFLIGSLLFHFVRQVMQIARLEAQRIALASEIRYLEAETQRLHGAVEYAESDVYVERIAREQLGYAREGDIVLFPRFLSPPPEPTPVLPDPLPRPPVKPNWLLWWDALSGRGPAPGE
ncbi:MAG: septum formation initiator family protein [Chloroflexaceae bacterium]|nr:septum formation initiator family protein [Chloroflexaceae bacterium]